MKATCIIKNWLYISVLLTGFFEILSTSLTGQSREPLYNNSYYIFIPMVAVGDPGNARDSRTGYGSVDSNFLMGKYDVTAEEYCAFLNAVASSDPYGLYDPRMGTDASVACIRRYGTAGANNYSYQVISDGAHREKFPITYVSWFSAARFCNWLYHNQSRGAEDENTTEAGIYQLNGAMTADDITDDTIFQPSDNATFFLPSEDQWYKAAYHQKGTIKNRYWIFPTQSNTLPGNTIGSSFNEANIYLASNWWNKFSIGSSCYFSTPTYRITPVGSFTGTPNPYGTYDMGGNVSQWMTAATSSEDISGHPSISSVIRGGDWDTEAHEQQKLSLTHLYLSGHRVVISPDTKNNLIGFRVAAPYNSSNQFIIRTTSLSDGDSHGFFTNLSTAEKFGLGLGAAALLGVGGVVSYWAEVGICAFSDTESIVLSVDDNNTFLNKTLAKTTFNRNDSSSTIGSVMSVDLSETTLPTTPGNIANSYVLTRGNNSQIAESLIDPGRGHGSSSYMNTADPHASALNDSISRSWLGEQPGDSEVFYNLATGTEALAHSKLREAIQYAVSILPDFSSGFFSNHFYN